MLVEQYRAFSSDGFGDEEVFANGHGRGVELIELKIGDLRSGTQCGGQSIAGGHGGIGGVRVESARTARGEDHARRVDCAGFGFAVHAPHDEPHAGDMPVAHNQIVQKRVLKHVDAPILTNHGAHIEFEHLAGGVPSGVHHAGTAVRGFEPAQHRTVLAAIHMPSGGDEFAHAARPLIGEHVHCGAVA